MHAVQWFRRIILRAILFLFLLILYRILPAENNERALFSRCSSPPPSIETGHFIFSYNFNPWKNLTNQTVKISARSSSSRVFAFVQRNFTNLYTIFRYNITRNKLRESSKFHIQWISLMKSSRHYVIVFLLAWNYVSCWKHFYRSSKLKVKRIP